jgi:hypothetical protein
MKRLTFLKNPYVRTTVLGLMAMSAAVACGSIDDPTKTRGTNERLETISGALTGTTVPANAHVALVWKVGAENKWAVLSDVPVVNGSFSMNLTPPPANYYVKVDQSESYDSLSGGSSSQEAPTTPRQPSEPAPSVPKGGGKAAFDKGLSPRDVVSGSTIKEPLSVAMAGFVVYVDKNNNGKLDLDNNSYLSSPDELIGGNRELLLVNFQEGGALDYEKLRDKSGILPHAGYNLAWADQERWLPLNVVELKISDSPTLPRPVCDRDGVSSTSPYDPGPSSGTGGSTGTSSDAGAGGGYYPSPGDPNLTCSNDGRTYQYNTPCTPPPPPPPQPKGLCSNSSYGNDPMPYACTPGYAETILPGAPIPPGWPCPVTVSDGGSAGTDSGVPIDAGSGGDAGF